jgi:hypothetical protein
MNDSTEIALGLSSDSTTLRYSIPLKEYISEQQQTIKDLNTKLNQTEIKLEDCRTETAALTKEVSATDNIYGFLTSTNGLVIFLVLVVALFIISKRSRISFKDFTIEPKIAKKNKQKSEESDEK